MSIYFVALNLRIFGILVQATQMPGIGRCSILVYTLEVFVGYKYKICALFISIFVQPYTCKKITSILKLYKPLPLSYY